ncbi:MAG TPA: hypothetical protein VHH36_08845 [Candidatus Thermoplasmatota archaeon]|nr:hypothetical protein [Candidatus Thermoplasmatota archaeon]
MRFNAWTLLSILVLLVGVAAWLWLSSTFGAGGDVGAYSVGAPLVAFGVAGALASLATARPAA